MCEPRVDQGHASRFKGGAIDALRYTVGLGRAGSGLRHTDTASQCSVTRGGTFGTVVAMDCFQFHIVLTLEIDREGAQTCKNLSFGLDGVHHEKSAVLVQERKQIPVSAHRFWQLANKICMDHIASFSCSVKWPSNGPRRCFPDVHGEHDVL